MKGDTWPWPIDDADEIETRRKLMCECNRADYGRWLATRAAANRASDAAHDPLQASADKQRRAMLARVEYLTGLTAAEIGELA